MKAVQVALAISLAILLPLLAEMTVRIWATPPKSDEYYSYYPEQPKTPEERAKADADMRFRSDKLEKAQAVYNLQEFYVGFPLGMLEILAGFLLRRRATLAAGLVFGGISTFGCGSFFSWETLPGWARYASLLFALLFVGTLAYALDQNRERPA